VHAVVPVKISVKYRWYLYL